MIVSEGRSAASLFARTIPALENSSSPGGHHSLPQFEAIALKRPTDSPFLKQTEQRLSFTTVLLLLLMVVGAGVGLLVYNALSVPAITTELDAWLGRQSKSVATADSREAQITFVLFCYSAPLLLGILVNALHQAFNYWDRQLRDRQSSEDDEFRM
jgi:hypothetical protein